MKLSSTRPAFRPLPGAASSATNLSPRMVPRTYQLSDIRALLDGRRYPEAEHICRQGLLVRPDEVRLLGMLGESLINQGRHREGFAVRDRMVELLPQDSPLYYFLRAQQCLSHDPAAAIAMAEECLQRGYKAPHQAYALMAHATAMLGDFKAYGEFTLRAVNVGVAAGAPDEPYLFNLAGVSGLVRVPRWRAQSLEGKTVVWFEPAEGFGDAIQFARYLPAIRAMGARIIIACRPPMRSFLETLRFVDPCDMWVECRGKIIEGRSTIPPVLPRMADYVISPSDGVLFAPPHRPPTVEESSALIPYLSVLPERQERFKTLIGEKSTSLRVGVAWACGEDFDTRFLTSSRRGMSAAYLAPLSSIPGVSLYSLQKGPSEQDYSRIPGCVSLMGQMRDFADTAAFISLLDLVVTVDTSVVHVAAAIGKPVWVILPSSSCWRWHDDSEVSRWYPSIRLFRCPGVDDWQEPVARVVSSLAERVR